MTTTGASYCFNYGFLNDNTDNIDNGKNRRNWGCHKVTYNWDNRDYLFVIVVVCVVIVVIVVTVVSVVF